MNIVTIGNCQAAKFAELMSILYVDVSVGSSHWRSTSSDSTRRLLDYADIVFIQSAYFDDITKAIETSHSRAMNSHRIPSIFFNGFHPDFTFIEGLRSPMGKPVSAIAAYGLLAGLDLDETLRLFNPDVYRDLGYFDCYDIARNALIEDCSKCGIDVTDRFRSWAAGGCFVYTPNHPVRDVLVDIVVDLGHAHHIPIDPSADVSSIYDFRRSLSWPIYPEIADRLGLDGDMTFYLKKKPQPTPGVDAFDVSQYVGGIYEINSQVDRDAVLGESFVDPRRLEVVRGFAKRSGLTRRRPSRLNPYARLPPHRFWSKAVAGTAVEAVDPVVQVKFPIELSTNIATAGSCFAQHLARHLDLQGYRHLVVETGRHLDAARRSAENYGVFSARYGNLYTVRQLVQLFDRSEGRFAPVEKAWEVEGRYRDPFRPEIIPDGFATAAELERDRAEHLAQVRRMWRDLDVFVFTMGLTECWRSKVDGAVFPVAPGVVSSSVAPENYEFHNFSVREVQADIESFVDRLKQVNPGAKVLLTVSPTPLIATYADRHVLTATTYSKSVLRVAAEEASSRHPDVEYFPSYEIITGSYSRGAYFENDLRSVNPSGIAHVMRVFMSNFSAGADNTPSSRPGQRSSILSAIERSRSVDCEEELNEIAPEQDDAALG